ncbi:hypothetical protein VNO80_33950 [Phaseolus coccineus]|uniref:Uncharacterized protein n=1 Tax=Phaseolus coccineus TaxID=3886 RepID=A0AAN9Q8N2_PHACN
MPLSSCSSERVSKQPSTVAVVELNKRELIKARILEEDQGGKIPGWDKYGLCLCKRKRRNSGVVVVSLRTGIRGFVGLPTFFFARNDLPSWNSSPPTPEARMAYYRSVRSCPLGTWIPNLEDPEPIRFSQTRVESFIFFIRLPSRSRSGSALGQRASLRNLFLLSFRGHEMNPEVTLSLASLSAPQLYSLRGKRRLSNSQQVKAFFGWGPRVPPPTTQFLSSELHYGDRLLSAMALHLVGKSERK